MDTGEQIRKARKNAGLTQEELAKRIDVATITIRQYETGKRQPRLEQLQLIANALGVHLLDLIGAEEELEKYQVEVNLSREQIPELQDIEKIYDSLSDKEKAEFLEAVHSGITKKEPAAPKGDELTTAVIFGRDGKRVKRTYSKEQMETVYKLLDAIPHKDEDI